MLITDEKLLPSGSLRLPFGDENLDVLFGMNRVDRVTHVTSAATGLIVTPGRRAVAYKLPLSNQEDIPLITRVKCNSPLRSASILNVRPNL